MARNKRITSASGTSAQSRTDFNPDYTYVKKDLARIGTLAGIFIAVLIIISFIIK
jgi:hypothetical protein